ncbi:MAG TPA: aspartate aminotransferase family protein [Chthoniobacteraceae bacterium]|nr:aspartate aminotransferase family protein [Chthoniobacteraceae bacterium]
MALPEIITEIPGARSRELAAKLRRYESRNVTYLADDWPIFWDRAQGTNVWDVDGNRFLDLTSAFGVAGLGHTNERVRGAIHEQSARLMHGMGDVHPTAPKAELCARLSELTFERWGAGPGKVILGNSGFEAVEAALKTSIMRSGKPGVIAFTGSYHGLGFGALTVTQLPFFREPFRASLKEFASFVPFPHEGGPKELLENLEDEIEAIVRQREIGCILVEPVQGRGGCVVPPREFLPMLRTICDSHVILLILDEIYTGFNRTGALFATEHSGVVPDVICLGKAMTGGFPMSACVGREDVMDAWPPSTGEALHTSTFLGNPLGCSMALASLEQHARAEVAQLARERGERFRQALLAIDSPWIENVRGLGLMLGVVLVDDTHRPATELAITLVKAALRDGLIFLADSPDSNVLSFSPPFAITDEEMDFVVTWLARELSRSARS